MKGSASVPPREGLSGGSAPPVRVLYVGGSGRSGSTLLDRILGQVPGLWSVGEIVHIWRRGVAENQLCGCGTPFRECPFWTQVGVHAFGGWENIDVDDVLRLQHRVDRNRYIPLMAMRWISPSYRRSLAAYSKYLAALYGGIKRVSGKEIIVDSAKHASYAFLLRQVPEIELRVLHLTRDPRGVAYSWTKQVEKPEITSRTEYMPRYHPGRMGVRWLSYNALFHLLKRLRTPTRFVRYESLVGRPRAEVEAILQFAGLAPQPEGLSFIGENFVDLAPTHTVAGNPMRFKQGRLELREDEQWRREMDRHQRRLVAWTTWPLMRSYGYRLGGYRERD